MKIKLAQQGRTILTASLLLGALLVPLLSIQNAAAQTPVSFLVSWSSSCPAGYTDTGLQDDSDGNVDLGEEDTTKTTRLCIRSADSNITLSSMWADYSCPAGWTFTGVTDDAGSISAPDDTPSNHALGEKDYRPDTDRDHYAWCIKATGTASVTPFLDINWLYGSCPANSTAIVSQKSGNVLNLNTQELNSSKVWMCATLSEIVTPSPTANLSCSPSSLPSGGSCTLSWSSANATSCTGTNFSTGGATSGSVSTGPLTSSRSYSVTCTNSAGSASANTTVTVTGAPDLTAGGISPTTAVAGTSKTFFSTISNTGAASTGSTFSTLFQVSSNSSGSGASDVGVVTTATLAAGGSASASSGYTFSSAGTYYMRACADKSSASSPGSITESNESNNCGPWTAITVTAAATALGGSCTVSPTSISVGGSATWTASAYGGSGLYTYAWATPGSTWTDNGSSRTSVYNTAGTYTAYVNITSNGVTTRVDCSNSVTVANTPPPSQPDLTAGGISPTSVTAGTSRNFSSTISNIGGASTGSGFITLFQVSSNSSGSGASDVGIVTTAAIAAGGSASVSSGYTFSSAGTYYMRACADKSSAASSGSITESNESNNCGPWTAITVSGSAVGAGVCGSANGGSYTSFPSSGQCSSAYSFTITDSSGSDGSYNWTCNSSDGGTAVPPAAACSATAAAEPNWCDYSGPNRCTVGSASNQFYSQPLYYWQCTYSTWCTYDDGSGNPMADLTGQAITPTTAYVGVPTNFLGSIRNIGAYQAYNTGPSGPGFYNLRQTANDSSGSGAANLSTWYSNSLNAGQGTNATFSRTFPSVGTYYMRICADLNTSFAGLIDELNESNNCGPWTAIVVGNAPPPSTACTVTPSTLPSTGGTVTYRANGANGATSPYTWTPSDGLGSYGTGSTATRTFTSAQSGSSYGMSVTASPSGTSNCPLVTVGTVCSGTPTGTIAAAPSRVRSGSSTTLTVSNLQNVRTSCTLTGPGVNQSYPGNSCVATGGNAATPAITTQSTYILTCDGTEVDRVIINILPNFTEF